MCRDYLDHCSRLVCHCYRLPCWLLFFVIKNGNSRQLLPQNFRFRTSPVWAGPQENALSLSLSITCLRVCTYTYTHTDTVRAASLCPAVPGGACHGVRVCWVTSALCVCAEPYGRVCTVTQCHLGVSSVCVPMSREDQQQTVCSLCQKCPHPWNDSRTVIECLDLLASISNPPGLQFS